MAPESFITYHRDEEALTIIGHLMDSHNKHGHTLNDISFKLRELEETVTTTVTTNLSGGTGIEITNDNIINLDFSEFSTDNITEGSTNLFHSDERVDDRISNLLQEGSNIVHTYDDVANTFTISTSMDPTFDTVDSPIVFTAVADVNIIRGQVVYISGTSGSGTTPTVNLAIASDPAKMPAFGMARDNVNAGDTIKIVTFGSLYGITLPSTITFALGDTLYVSSVSAGAYTNVSPGGESNLIQNIGKVQKIGLGSSSVIKVGGAGRTNATSNLNYGNIFYGNSSNKAVTATLTEGNNVTITHDSANSTLTISALIDGGSLEGESQHVSGSIAHTHTVVDIHNTWESDTQYKGAILSLSDNSYDSGTQTFTKTVRAAIKGGTTSTGPDTSGYLAMHTSDGTGNEAREVARFTSEGKFGLGEINPDLKFHVNSGSINECARFESSDTEVTIELKDITGTASLKCRNDFRFNNSINGELLRITTDGKVGIGEDTPDAILHITSSILGGPQIKIGNGTDHSFINFDGTSLQLSTQRDMVNGNWSNTAKSWGGITIHGHSSGSSILFYTSPTNNTAASQRMILDENGVLGINTTPGNVSHAKLVVNSGDGKHPAIKTGVPSANGHTMLADHYTATESQFHMGVGNSGTQGVISHGCKVSHDTNNKYLSSHAQYSTRPMALCFDAGDFVFKNTNTSATTTVDTEVTLTEKLRINNVGAIGIGGANYGTSGQVLKSNGASAPSWHHMNAISVVKKLSVSIPSNTNTTITFDTEVKDTHGWFTSPSTAVTPNITGTYLITARVYALDSTNRGLVNIYRDTTIIASHDSGQGVPMNDFTACVHENITSGQAIKLLIYQNSGSTKTCNVTLGVQLITT